MACPLSVVKKLHVALLQFVFVHKNLILSWMCFGSCYYYLAGCTMFPRLPAPI